MERIRFIQIVIAQREIYDQQTDSGKILDYVLYGLTREGVVYYFSENSGCWKVVVEDD